jgi:hypothetical protein
MSRVVQYQGEIKDDSKEVQAHGARLRRASHGSLRQYRQWQLPQRRRAACAGDASFQEFMGGLRTGCGRRLFDTDEALFCIGSWDDCCTKAVWSQVGGIDISIGVRFDLDHVNCVAPQERHQPDRVHRERRAVDKVLIGGKLVVAGGRAIGIDRAALVAKAQAAVERLAALKPTPGASPVCLLR